MIRRFASRLIVASCMFCLVGTSIQAVDLEDVYVTAGVVHWPEFGSSDTRFSFQFPSVFSQLASSSESSSQTSFKFGAGYTIDESWSVEAVAIVGMEHETSIPSLFDSFYTGFPEVVDDDDFEEEFEIDFGLSPTRKLKASILRINPVYTISLQRDFFLFGKAGIAFIERDLRITIRAEYGFSDELGQELDILFPPTLQISSESDSTTNLFASAGLKWSPNSRRSAISISYSNYFDTPGDITNSLELEYQWKF